MRLVPVFAALLVVVASAAGCKSNKSLLDKDRGADVDALWDLAPDDTQLGVVASPRAVGLAIRAVNALRDISTQSDLAPAKPQIDVLVKGLFGSETGNAEDA